MAAVVVTNQREASAPFVTSQFSELCFSARFLERMEFSHIGELINWLRTQTLVRKHLVRYVSDLMSFKYLIGTCSFGSDELFFKKVLKKKMTPQQTNKSYLCWSECVGSVW